MVLLTRPSHPDAIESSSDSRPVHDAAIQEILQSSRGVIGMTPEMAQGILEMRQRRDLILSRDDKQFVGTDAQTHASTVEVAVAEVKNTSKSRIQDALGERKKRSPKSKKQDKEKSEVADPSDTPGVAAAADTPVPSDNDLADLEMDTVLDEVDDVDSLESDDLTEDPINEHAEGFEEVDFGMLGIDPGMPTPAMPGTEGKVMMLAARYAAGVPLWNEKDALDHDSGKGRRGNMINVETREY